MACATSILVTSRAQAVERYRLLIQQLGDEEEFSHGWQTRVGKRIGVDQTYVSKIHLGTRTSVGQQAIERAIERLGLDPSYFYGDAEGALNYRDYIGPTKTIDAGMQVHIAEDEDPLVEGWISGMGLEGQEAEAARAVRFSGGPTVDKLERWLTGYRGARSGKVKGVEVPRGPAPAGTKKLDG